jgi:hypothetical protein
MQQDVERETLRDEMDVANECQKSAIDEFRTYQ